MTVAKLHKYLTGLIGDGLGRKKVYIRKDTFSHPLEGDGCVILDVVDADIMGFPRISDDGGQARLANGKDAYMDGVVLFGCSTPIPEQWFGMDDGHPSGDKSVEWEAK